MCHKAQCAVGNLPIKVRSLKTAQTKILTTFFYQYFDVPTNLINFESFDELHARICSDDCVPMLVPTDLDEEYSYRNITHHNTYVKVHAFVLATPLGLSNAER